MSLAGRIHVVTVRRMLGRMSRQALSDVCRSMEQQAQSRTLKELVVMWVWLTLILLSRVLDRLLQHIAALIRQVDEQRDEIDAEVNDINDCWEFAVTGSDDESNMEGLETELGRPSATGKLIPGLPDDLVAVQIWPLILLSFSEMRHVNREWRRFVTTSPEWLAMEVVRLSERFNMRGYAFVREALADQVEAERHAIMHFLRELNREELFGM
ncbi:hypothetical protein R1sor_001002 [Riccia sorocarpa]|uniref:F-box domain-containing protein n=1 Tax=Riccia sorocarpa TaxID=122646 RepID=A0ABD3GUQ1_9MARC